jgi:hypothetical protein
MRARSLLFVVPVVVALAAAWTVLGRDAGSRRAVAEHPVVVPEAPRTVSVSTTMPAPSPGPRRLAAMLEDGVLPSRRAMAEVVSDTECTPDARMISHCRNEVRLADGRTIVLRHPHDMRDVPCLAPGESVLLVSAPAKT